MQITWSISTIMFRVYNILLVVGNEFKIWVLQILLAEISKPRLPGTTESSLYSLRPQITPPLLTLRAIFQGAIPAIGSTG